MHFSCLKRHWNVSHDVSHVSHVSHLKSRRQARFVQPLLLLRAGLYCAVLYCCTFLYIAVFLVWSCLILSCPVLPYLSPPCPESPRTAPHHTTPPYHITLFHPSVAFALSMSCFLHRPSLHRIAPHRTAPPYDTTPFHPPVRLSCLCCWLCLGQGQKLCILGPNGAGKSTLLNALAGVLPLSEGERNEGEGLKLGVFTQVKRRALGLL